MPSLTLSPFSEPTSLKLANDKYASTGMGRFVWEDNKTGESEELGNSK
jgi:hypothetical protein